MLWVEVPDKKKQMMADERAGWNRRSVIWVPLGGTFIAEMATSPFKKRHGSSVESTIDKKKASSSTVLISPPTNNGTSDI